MSRILVTGGAGYIGSHTVTALVNAGHKVVALDNLVTGFKEAIDSTVDFVFGDIRDEALLSQIISEKKIEAVVHLAALLNVKESKDFPLEYYENNTFGLLSVLKAMQKNNIDQIVFSSTAAVFGDTVQDRTISENDAQCPINPYGESKLASEKILKTMSDLGKIRFCILRYFNVAGAALDGQNGQRTKNAYHLVHLGAQAALKKRDQIEIFGTDYPTKDGTCIRDYIHVEDLANVHVLALNSLLEGASSEYYNCGYGFGYSVREILSTIQKVSVSNFKVIESPRRPGDPASLVADSTRLKSNLNWKPKYSDIDIICKTALDWENKYTRSLK